MERPARSHWLRWVVSAAVLWGTIMITMAWFEESLIFFPERYPSGEWNPDIAARGTGATIGDCDFSAADGIRLHGWLCEPGGGEAPSGPVLLWFHGNAGHLAHRSEVLLLLSRIPARVFIIDYRGYGRSEGRPTEKGLYRDGRAAWRYLIEEKGIDPSRIVIYGVSLGGAVAVDLAREVESAGLIVQSSFTSVPAMAKRYYPFIPTWMIRTRLDSLAKIGEVTCPIMVAHSPADDVVPYECGERLFATARGDKRFVEIEGAGHNETWLVGGERYLDAVRGFVADCTNGGDR